MNLEQISEHITELTGMAIQAGDAIMEIYTSEDFDIEHKDDDSPLTRADKAANKIICDYLESFSPDVPIISEENKEIPYAERKNYTLCWMVDPLDGTKEFIKRNGQFTVNIALIDNNEVTFGIVYAPALQELFYALKGRGAYMTKEKMQSPLKANQFSRDEQGIRVVCSRSHLNAETQNFIDDLKEPEKVSIGSSLKFIILAKGQAELYPRLAPTMEWDTAAAQIILEEAGGQVLHAETGEKLTYNKENLLNPYFIASGIEL